MRELRSFIVLAEQLHFGRAAQLLHLSQPALSKQIKKLEGELGGSLFERDRHGSRLSAFGVRFLREARPIGGASMRCSPMAAKRSAARPDCCALVSVFTPSNSFPSWS